MYFLTILLPLGGITNGHNDMLDSVAVFNSKSNQWEDGPKLPEAISAMCAVKLDDTEIFVAGGDSFEDAYLVNTWIYNVFGEEWHATPNLLHPREAPACAYFVDEKRPKESRVVIAGN